MVTAVRNHGLVVMTTASHLTQKWEHRSRRWRWQCSQSHPAQSCCRRARRTEPDWREVTAASLFLLLESLPLRGYWVVRDLNMWCSDHYVSKSGIGHSGVGRYDARAEDTRAEDRRALFS